MSVETARWHRVPVNHRGDWLFVELIDQNGLAGLGEASHSGDDAQTVAVLDRVCRAMQGVQIEQSGLPDVVTAITGTEPHDKPTRTALSAIEQAMSDYRARHVGRSVARALGETKGVSEIDIYTNLNRMCADRSPETVANAGKLAQAGGVSRMKFAPFDEVSVEALSAPGAIGERVLEPARQRLAALRDAVGPEVFLMIDCHWRFPDQSLSLLAQIAGEFAVSWIEDPFPVLTRGLSDQLRDQTGAQITGGEQFLTFSQFEQYLQSSGVDVLIADVKHVGGIRALHRICQLAGENNVAFAPHNPSGPVSTAASAHVCAANDNANLLEYPFGEVDWRQDFAPAESVSGQRIQVCGPGLGVTLDWKHSAHASSRTDGLT